MEQGRIGLTLRVGVTGHRDLTAEASSGSVASALDALCEAFAGRHVPVRLVGVSALAEGADRIFAHEILRRPGATLEVSLPFPAERYLEDFPSPASKTEFGTLLGHAVAVRVGPEVEERRDGYEWVGSDILARADALIALWDGQPARGRGGTAHVVGAARERGMPLVWIDTRTGAAIAENLDALPRLGSRASEKLAAFDRLEIDPEAFAAKLAKKRRDFGVDRTTTLPVDAVADWIAPVYVRADLLAGRHQRRVTWATRILYGATASAVLVVTLEQIVWHGEKPWLAWIELGLLAMSLVAVLWTRRADAHDRWIEYRFLAERLRSMFFLALGGWGQDRSEVPDVGARAGEPAEEWIGRAVEEVWNSRPAVAVAEQDTSELKAFLRSGWIDDQRAYLERTSLRHKQRHRRFGRLIYGLVALTAFAAVLHAREVWHHDVQGDLVSVVSIWAPAVAAAIAGLGEQREYERNADRYQRTADQLAATQRAMDAAGQPDEIRSVLDEMRALMLEENSDWFGVMRFREPHVTA